MKGLQNYNKKMTYANLYAIFNEIEKFRYSILKRVGRKGQRKSGMISRKINKEKSPSKNPGGKGNGITIRYDECSPVCICP